jgi:Fur family iron response transcriptional regulator
MLMNLPPTMAPNLSKKAIAEKLRASGINPTSQRVEISFFFFNTWMHLSADQILDGVNREYPAVSRGTVYNALNLLVEKDLILEVIAAPGKVFYDPNPTPHHHIYFVDRGTLEDVPNSQTVGISKSDSPCIAEIMARINLPQECWMERIDVVVRARG